jgi:predicted dehydrogenase
MKKLRAGVIGLGIGNQHALAFLEHDDVELVAVCDLDRERVHKATAEWSGVAGYQNAEDLLASGLDVVAIASYDHDHVHQVVKALTHGIHVFAEKPLCVSDTELAQIGDALDRDPRLRLSSNTILRRSPRFIDLRESIDRGSFGKLFYVEADYVYGRFHKITQDWRGESPGYSVMLSGGIHMVDLLLWLTGDPIVEVSSFGNNLAGREANSPFPGADLVAALLRFESGLTGKVTANFASVYPHFHRVLAYGTKATFENRLGAAELWESRDAAVPPKLLNTPYPGVRKGDLIPSFIDGILGRGAPLVNEDDVFATMQACLAINQSLREGKNVRVPPQRRFGRPT